MNRTMAGSIPDDRVTRRNAVVRLAGAGAAAAAMAMHPGRSQGAAPAESYVQSPFVIPRKGPAMSQSTPASDSLPTVVLVHGAFADSSSWNGVIPLLQAQGYPVVAAANPLRSVAGDADYVASVLAGIAGPIVLVGHSYGGIVISNAALGNDNVKALVFVAAFAPEAGENAIDLSARFPGSTLGDALAAFPSPDGTELFIRSDVFHPQFCADLPEDAATLMAATQRPVTQEALSEGAGEPAWTSIPSWFVYAELDKNIPVAVEEFMAERAGAREAVVVPGASHVVMTSQPQAVADVIVKAIDAVS